MRRIALVLLLAIGLAIGLAGSAGAKTTDPTKAGAAWLSALFATGSANPAQEAGPLTAAGSPANAYTVHQIGVLKAQAGSGGGGNPYSVKTKRGNVELCQKTLNGNTLCHVRSLQTRQAGPGQDVLVHRWQEHEDVGSSRLGDGPVWRRVRCHVQAGVVFPSARCAHRGLRYHRGGRWGPHSRVVSSELSASERASRAGGQFSRTHRRYSAWSRGNARAPVPRKCCAWWNRDDPYAQRSSQLLKRERNDPDPLAATTRTWFHKCGQQSSPRSVDSSAPSCASSANRKVLARLRSGAQCAHAIGGVSRPSNRRLVIATSSRLATWLGY
jgi:hypothetical protein